MIFTFSHYNDLGRCSYATLMESFNTELDEIYLNDKKVEIEKVEDLFPFLWQSPGSAVRTGSITRAFFTSPGTHWHHDYDKSVENAEKEIKRIQTKIIKNPESKRLDSWMNEVKYQSDRRQGLLSMMERLDNELEKQKQELIEENHKE